MTINTVYLFLILNLGRCLYFQFDFYSILLRICRKFERKQLVTAEDSLWKEKRYSEFKIIFLWLYLKQNVDLFLLSRYFYLIIPSH